MKALFWGLVAIDVLGIAVLFLLGLAAAGPSRTSPEQVTLLLLVLPGLVLAAAVALFLKAGTMPLRLLAIVVAAAPLAIAFASRAIAQLEFSSSLNAAGEMTYFRAGPMREIAEAITRNDAATVESLAKSVEINKVGSSGMTLLGIAMRQLRATPTEHGVLRALLAAGADPNQVAQSEYPLSVAIQMSGKSGPEPVRMLLDAGANPNLIDEFGTPVYFVASGVSVNPETLGMLIDRGANVNAIARNNTTALFHTAMTQNWQATLVLLHRGADWKLGRSANGVDFATLIESYSHLPDENGLGDVRKFLKERR